MNARALLMAATVAVLGLLWWHRQSHELPAGQHGPAGPGTERIAGGDGGGLPRATPADEHIDAAGLERAGSAEIVAGLRALVVMRHGHLVYERYAPGVDGETPVDGGGMARAVLVLAAGIAAANADPPASLDSAGDADGWRAFIEKSSGEPYAAFLSRHLWRRLNAGEAWIEHAPGTSVPADCCLHARVLDWMRLAALMVDAGRFEGTQIVPAAWIQRVQRGVGVEPATSASGAERFASQGVFFLRGQRRWRLWLVPELQLAVLFGSELPARAATGSEWDETRLPNAVIRAVSDRPAEPGELSQLQQLVPGH